MEDCINSDLANNYGNLCQRVTSFAIKNCESKIPNKVEFQKEDIEILDKYKNNLDNIRDKIDNQNINFYIDETLDEMYRVSDLFQRLEKENQMGNEEE